jgi:hypothetical protein
MRAIEEKQAAKFAKQKEHQKAFDKLRKQREYAETVRSKAREMLEKSVVVIAVFHVALVLIFARRRVRDARGDSKAEVLSSDVIAARLKQVMLMCIPCARRFGQFSFGILTAFCQGVKLPPIAARQLRDEARELAIEKLSARRAEAEQVSVSMVLDVADDPPAEHASSHRSHSSHQSQAVSAVAARDSRLGQGFLSPEYGDDFESGVDAVAQHVSSFMGANAQGADDQDEGDDYDSGGDDHPNASIDVSHYLFVPYHQLYSMRFTG